MKKRIIVISLLATFIVNGFAQNISPYINRIDSIQNLLDSNPSEDTLRVVRLNDLARLCFYDFQYGRGALATVEALRLSKNLDFKKGEGLYWRTIQELHYNANQINPYQTLSTWAYEDAHLKENFIEIKPAPDDRDYQRKITQLVSSVSLVEKTGEREILGHLYYMLSHNYFQTGKMIEALTFAEKAEINFSDSEQNIPLLEAMIYKIRILKQLGKEDFAKEEELEATQLIANLPAERKKALTYYIMAGYYFNNTKSTELTLDYLLQSNQLLEKLGEVSLRLQILGNLGHMYKFVGMPEKAVESLREALQIREENNDGPGYPSFYLNYAQRLIDLKEFDEAEKQLQKAEELNADKWSLLDTQGQLLMGLGHFEAAIDKFFQLNSLDGIERGNPSKSLWINYYLAYCFQQLGQYERSNRYGLYSFEQSNANYSLLDTYKKACQLIYENYDHLGQTAEAYKYLKKYAEIMREYEQIGVANRTANLEIQSLIEKSNEEKIVFEQQKLAQEKALQNQRWWMFSIAAGLFSSFIVVLLLIRNNRNKQKAKQKIESAYNQLKSTQTQLIQSEKMASLGELTAGIAHEIQNPLNFVNNFSEVSKELLEEMKEELASGNLQPATEISGDVIQNLDKILHHGKRAEAIVKGMLQHSRASSGQKELTDINTLCDEYLRLSYHGLRAKDKSFNADFKLEADENLPKIEVIPQDIGRVLLNLINNAFFAVNEKAKQNIDGYKPEVVVCTSSSPFGEGGLRGVKITVADNGPGIPDSIKDKIFQPFFTTKPTGQGTGLGLSLSYDIVKAHGGELKVETKENEGTTFIIQLPTI